MPWHKNKRGDEICITDKTGKQLHCYPNTPQGNKRADKYLAALNANAGEEAKEVGEGVYLEKEADGRYKIIAVSTAQLKDRDGETYDVGAMDYEIAQSKETGAYPEFRVFHKKSLGIGKVEKMSRVGIFAVDEGHSYTDPFSVQVCEKMLANNNGKWRVSRGFYALEVSGDCPRCKEHLLVEKQHMIVGFLCPTCKQYHPQYKGVLSDVHFRKTKTFDVSVTDIPCVPYTGVTAVKDLSNSLVEEEMAMSKKDLEKKLLGAGVSKEAVEERLGSVTDEQLKEFSDLPFAEVLKELDVSKEEPEEDPETFVLDETVLKEFADIVAKQFEDVEERLMTRVKELFEGMELDVPDFELKELPQLKELAEEVAEIKEAVEELTRNEQDRLKELVADMPRNGKLRVARFKSKPPKKVEDDEEEEDDEEDEPMMLKKQHIGSNDQIVGADGYRAKNMTDFISGGK